MATLSHPIKEGEEDNMEGVWEKVSIRLDLNNVMIDRKKGMYFGAYYRRRLVAYVYCSGVVEFAGKEKWKIGWEFKHEYDHCGCVKMYKWEWTE